MYWTHPWNGYLAYTPMSMIGQLESRKRGPYEQELPLPPPPPPPPILPPSSLPPSSLKRTFSRCLNNCPAYWFNPELPSSPELDPLAVVIPSNSIVEILSKENNWYNVGYLKYVPGFRNPSSYRVWVNASVLSEPWNEYRYIRA